MLGVERGFFLHLSPPHSGAASVSVRAGSHPGARPLHTVESDSSKVEVLRGKKLLLLPNFNQSNRGLVTAFRRRSPRCFPGTVTGARPTCPPSCSNTPEKRLENVAQCACSAWSRILRAQRLKEEEPRTEYEEDLQTELDCTCSKSLTSVGGSLAVRKSAVAEWSARSADTEPTQSPRRRRCTELGSTSNMDMA
ncbi:unnamed protein product [Pleuronectes platessa]|uniref:Uncharacterized protein n=1 Tax=Pleuronectes platessa TaxID=8262 RepID=A0A9N7V2P4_PLEPL|nr:unnamed protein product [Pleuronectes platessa]